MSLNGEKLGHFGGESVSYSQTNWQESFDLIQDWANRALKNPALDFSIHIMTLISSEWQKCTV